MCRCDAMGLDGYGWDCTSVVLLEWVERDTMDGWMDCAVRMAWPVSTFHFPCVDSLSFIDRTIVS